eukprot:4798994-Pleurochrysis_carterae.AAC.2
MTPQELEEWVPRSQAGLTDAELERLVKKKRDDVKQNSAFGAERTARARREVGRRFTCPESLKIDAVSSPLRLATDTTVWLS